MIKLDRAIVADVSIFPTYCSILYSIRACEICVHNVSEKIIIFSQQNTKPLKSVRKFISIIYLF